MTVRSATASLRAWRVGAVLCAGGAAAALLSQGVAIAQEVGPLRRVTAASPVAACTADDVAGQDDPAAGIVNYPNTEIEPWVDANPRNPRNLIAGWQQDRWSNGGARTNGLGVSRDGGATWQVSTVPGTSACAGGTYLRNSDPWVSFSPNGTAYYMTLAFDPDLPSGSFGRNAMLVNRSTDGGRSWSRPIVLRADPAGQALNDKNSITADPTDARFAYAVWDRLVDFTVPPANADAGAAAAASAGPRRRIRSMDAYAITRERVRQLKAAAEGGSAAAGAAAAAADPVISRARPTSPAPRTAAGAGNARG